VVVGCVSRQPQLAATTTCEQPSDHTTRQPFVRALCPTLAHNSSPGMSGNLFGSRRAARPSVPVSSTVECKSRPLERFLQVGRLSSRRAPLTRTSPPRGGPLTSHTTILVGCTARLVRHPAHLVIAAGRRASMGEIRSSTRPVRTALREQRDATNATA
jgi:hypothetical protein